MSIAALILRVSVLGQTVEPLWCPLDGRLLWALQREVSVSSQLEVEVTLVPEPGLDGADDLQTVRVDQCLTDSNSYIPVISNVSVCVCVCVGGGGGGEGRG